MQFGAIINLKEGQRKPLKKNKNKLFKKIRCQKYNTQ